MVAPLSQTAGYTKVEPKAAPADANIAQTVDQMTTGSLPPDGGVQQDQPLVSDAPVRPVPELRGTLDGPAPETQRLHKPQKLTPDVSEPDTHVEVGASQLAPSAQQIEVPQFQSVLSGIQEDNEPDVQVQEASLDTENPPINLGNPDQSEGANGVEGATPYRSVLSDILKPTSPEKPGKGLAALVEHDVSSAELSKASGILNFERAKGVNPTLLQVVENAQKFLPKGVRMSIGYEGGTRTREQQAALVAKGVSKTMNSRHLGGHAIDIHPVINGKNKFDSNDIEDWAAVRDAMKQSARELGVKVEWGGDWKNAWDKSHWQIG